MGKDKDKDKIENSVDKNSLVTKEFPRYSIPSPAALRASTSPTRGEVMGGGNKKPTNICRNCLGDKDQKTFPKCSCGGGGGAPGGAGSLADKGEVKDSAAISSKADPENKSSNQKENSHVIDLTTSQYELNDIKFDSKVISELLSKGILLIDNNKEEGALTIKLLRDAQLSPIERIELKKFINAIRNELDEFKKERKLECNIIKGNNSIRFELPESYIDFIQRLVSKQLLPKQVIEQQANEKVVYEAGVNHFQPTSTNLNPFHLRSPRDGFRRW